MAVEEISPVLASSVISASSFLMLRKVLDRADYISVAVPEDKRNVWFNTLVSMIHSKIVTIFFVFCFYADPSLWLKMIQEENSWLPRTTAAISIGYFVYDFFDLLQHHTLVNQWPVLAHHVIVVSEFIVFGWYYKWYNCLVVALTCEANTIFLHLRKLFRLAKISQNWSFYTLNKHVNSFTFIVFRLISIIWLLSSALFFDRDKFSTSMLRAFGIIGTSLMAIINLSLFRQIIKTDYFYTTKEQKEV